MQERILRHDSPAAANAALSDSHPADDAAPDTAALPSPRAQAGSAAQTPRSFLPSSVSSGSLAAASSLDGGSSGSGGGGSAAPGAHPAADAAKGAAAAAADGDEALNPEQERLGPAMLFFGCRRPDQDFLYGDLLQGWADAGQLELHTAFSRQQVCTSLN